MTQIETIEAHLAERYAGKLLLRQEIDLHDSVFEQTVIKKLFTPLPSIKRKILTRQCQRCGNEKQSLFANIPCQKCKKTHLYCRNCIMMGRVMECESLYYWTGPAPKWPRHENPCTWEGNLTDVQKKAADRIVEAVHSAEKELLIWAVCGAGKTEMLFPGMAAALEQGKRICIATPRADVVRELLPRIKRAFANVTIQGLYGGSKEKTATAQIIIATTHQLLRFKTAFDFVIIDEIDAFPYHQDSSLPFAVNRSKKKTCTTVYLTATPRRDLRMRISAKKLPHMFVPVRFHGHPLPVPAVKICFSLKRDLNMFKPPQAFATWLKKRQQPDRQLLIFTPTIELAEKMKVHVARILQQQQLLKGNQIESVHAEDPDREKKVVQFREKRLYCLITTTILERGVTFPSVDVVIMDAGHDVFDEAAIVQIAGRAGRSPDDPHGEVILFHDGKTDAINEAVRSIKAMNKRGGFH